LPLPDIFCSPIGGHGRSLEVGVALIPVGSSLHSFRSDYPKRNHRIHNGLFGNGQC